MVKLTLKINDDKEISIILSKEDAQCLAEANSIEINQFGKEIIKKNIHQQARSCNASVLIGVAYEETGNDFDIGKDAILYTESPQSQDNTPFKVNNPDLTLDVAEEEIDISVLEDELPPQPNVAPMVARGTIKNNKRRKNK